MIRASSRLSSGSKSWNFWPGFVDALASLLMVILFVLTVFVVGHVYLNQALFSKDTSLKSLQSEVTLMQDDMDEKEKSLEELQDDLKKLSAQYVLLNETFEETKNQLSARSAKYQDVKTALRLANLKAVELEDMHRMLQAQAEAEHVTKVLLEEEATTLKQEVTLLKKEFQRIAKALEISATESTKKDQEIQDLGQKLNTALSKKIEELAKYRSEFFGKLRQVLGERKDVHVVGDRFVFQSEVLFPTASAQLSREGKEQLTKFAQVLLDVQKQFPKDLNWVLRVDGHTDTRAIHTAAYPSNWHLSAARALEVVQFLIAKGISPKNLAATGFGEHHPLSHEKTQEGHKINRRIELKLDQH